MIGGCRLAVESRAEHFYHILSCTLGRKEHVIAVMFKIPGTCDSLIVMSYSIRILFRMFLWVAQGVIAKIIRDGGVRVETLGFYQRSQPNVVIVLMWPRGNQASLTWRLALSTGNVLNAGEHPKSNYRVG